MTKLRADQSRENLVAIQLSNFLPTLVPPNKDWNI